MKNIKKFWEHQECPSVNGVVFSDGSMQLMDIDVNWSANKKYNLTLGKKTSVKELDISGELEWNDCAVLVHEKFTDENIDVLAGEGDYGSDGFIAVLNSINHELVWLAFFDCSNPFNKIQLVDKELYAWSTNGTCWRFQLKSPIEITVE